MTSSPGTPPREPRPAIGPAIVQFVAAGALIFSTTAVLVYAVALHRAHGDVARVAGEAVAFAVSRAGIMSAACVSAGGLAAIALAGFGETSSIVARLRLGPTRATPAGWIAAAAGTTGLSAAAGSAASLIRERLGLAGGTLEIIGHALAHPKPGALLLELLTIAILPGAAEEMFFRGLLQTRLVRRFRTWPAILLTAAGFGLFHFDPVHSVLAFVAGAYLGWLAERFGGIRPTIAAHMFNNAIVVILGAAGPDTEPSGVAGAAVAAAGVLVWVASTAVLRSPLAVRGERPLTAGGGSRGAGR